MESSSFRSLASMSQRPMQNFFAYRRRIRFNVLRPVGISMAAASSVHRGSMGSKMLDSSPHEQQTKMPCHSGQIARPAAGSVAGITAPWSRIPYRQVVAGHGESCRIAGMNRQVIPYRQV